MTWHLVGHDWAVSLLQQSLATDRTAHAYLFAGPPQIGKMLLALRLAQALNCRAHTPPCGQCVSCRKIERHIHPDVELVESGDSSGILKIDQVRELQRKAALAPFEGVYRVFILKQADRASIEAANSLLKTLEEPPAHVVLILTAVQADSLPPTVVSRCQRLDLRLLPRRVVEGTLLERGLPPDQAQLLGRLSGGRLGWALHACENEETLHQRAKDLDLLMRLLQASRVDKIEFAWTASRNPDSIPPLIELWMTWWRDVLMIKSQGEEHLVNVDRFDQLRSLAGQSDLHQAWSIVKTLQETAAQLEANVNTRLALEGLLLRLPLWNEG